MTNRGMLRTTNRPTGRTASRPTSLLVLLLLAAMPFVAPASPARTGDAVTPAEALSRFEALEGHWAGTNSHGHRVTLDYEIVANGTAVLERLNMHSPDEEVHDMLTVYHLDGERLMLTHYCAAGNQPRMRATALESDRVAFAFIDGTSLTTPETGHMHRAEFEFTSPDRLVSRWTWREGGEDRFTESIEIERVDESTVERTSAH